MNLKNSRQGLFKVGLLIGLAVVITMMIAPNLNLFPALVPKDIEEGQKISEAIIITDELSLIDEKSTDSRRLAALEEFPPVYDYDPRLKNKKVEAVRTEFAKMRKKLAERLEITTETQNRILRNSQAQLENLVAIEGNRLRRGVLDNQSRILIDEIGRLNDLEKPAPLQVLRLEKLRFDLLAVDAQKVSAAQEGKQMQAKKAEFRTEGLRLSKAEDELRKGEQQTMATLKAGFESGLGISIEGPAFNLLREAQFNKELAGQVISLLITVYDDKIVPSLEGIIPKANAIQIQTLESNKLERFEDLKSVTDVPKVRARVEKLAKDPSFSKKFVEYRGGVVSLARRLIRANLTENKGDTERLKNELVKNLTPRYFKLKKGDTVAKKGDVATAEQAEIIRALNLHYLTNPKYPQIIGTFLIVLLTLGLCFRLMRQHKPAGMNSFRQPVLLAILVLVTLSFAQLILLLGRALTTIYIFIPDTSFNYLVPGALTAMLAGILLSFEIAVFLGFAASLSLAIMLDNSLSYFLFAVIGSFVASIPLQNYQSRFSIWQQGLRISAINVVVLGVLNLLEQNPLTWQLGWNLGAAALNGLGVAFLAATLLPVIEKLFDITTDLRLLEFSNMNHPALKELSVRAPGTYHHSIVVGNLSESAADGIQANPLLVRVASYYHDLGKMLCPLYFIENQGKKNYHDDLPAYTSARIIINHIKDGVEIARRYKLGKAITDIIAQHHGQSLVRYFFHKAQEERGELGDPLDENDFRYPGPKPQNKEAGLVMVADVTEAATRSLSDPSPEAIRQMVQTLATRIYSDGQLDQSGMTFNDLNYIEKTFTKMLVSIHHHRIAYPDLEGTGEQPRPGTPGPFRKLEDHDAAEPTGKPTEKSTEKPVEESA
ncbi:MAG: HDIG domain-containing metalloprotein [bacterium]